MYKCFFHVIFMEKCDFKKQLKEDADGTSRMCNYKAKEIKDTKLETTHTRGKSELSGKVK